MSGLTVEKVFVGEGLLFLTPSHCCMCITANQLLVIVISFFQADESRIANRAKERRHCSALIPHTLLWVIFSGLLRRKVKQKPQRYCVCNPGDKQVLLVGASSTLWTDSCKTRSMYSELVMRCELCFTLLCFSSKQKTRKTLISKREHSDSTYTWGFILYEKTNKSFGMIYVVIVT